MRGMKYIRYLSLQLVMEGRTGNNTENRQAVANIRMALAFRCIT